MTGFLLELRSEEIPARMQAGAKASLELLFRKQMEAADVAVGEIEVFATPRRIALIAHDLPVATDHKFEDIKGPRVGAPPQALEGFLRKVELTEDNLVQSDGVWWARLSKPGRPMQDVLAEAIPAIIRAFPWPKSMRWGDASASTESLRWVRPLQGIVALLGQDVVPCSIDGIESGAATMGHRFHHSGQITIGSAADYVEKLRACHVIVHFSERCAIIREGADAAARAAGLVLVEDEGLVAENAGLTEWPVPMLGRFDPAFLEVPEEVIQLTARVNQKYFVCHDKDGKLTNAFVCTANIVANDGGAAIVAGNEKVLAARLSDAKFFWEQDKKIALEAQAEKLLQIVFHEKLGTVADKVERVAKLARWLVTERIVTPAKAGVHHVSQSNTTGGIGSSLRWSDEEVEALAVQAERAARLCKADLVTGMVGEFPELQGIMGGYYARAQGESDAVADAIRDHYKPVGQGDDVPTAPVTVAVSLADKLDTLVGFFAINEKPTGSKDPYALRRAQLGIIETIVENRVRVGVRELFREAYKVLVNNLLERFFVVSRDVDKFDDQQWVSLLTGNAAFVVDGNELLLLKEEPSIGDGELNDSGSMEWNLERLKQLGSVSHRVNAFDETVNTLTEFTFDRLRDREKRAGRRADLISALLPREIVDVLAGLNIGKEFQKLPNTFSNDDVVRILRLGQSLQKYITTAEGANLLAAYKRAANILKGSHPVSPVLDRASDAPMADGKEQQIPQTGEEDPFVDVDQGMRSAIAGNEGRTEGIVPEGAVAADIALLGALDLAEPQAEKAVEEERFGDAMAALATLREPIDRFFDEVMVNDEDPDKRAFRLGLLARFRDAVHRVADFSRIEG